MSFSSDVKAEISKLSFSGAQARAMLCALFLSRASLNWNSQGTWLSFQTENASIAKLVLPASEKRVSGRYPAFHAEKDES